MNAEQQQQLHDAILTGPHAAELTAPGVGPADIAAWLNQPGRWGDVLPAESVSMDAIRACFDLGEWRLLDANTQRYLVAMSSQQAPIDVTNSQIVQNIQLAFANSPTTMGNLAAALRRPAAYIEAIWGAHAAVTSDEILLAVGAALWSAAPHTPGLATTMDDDRRVMPDEEG